MSVAATHLNELRRFISFPSISADPSKKHEVRNCAHWLAGNMNKSGLKNVNVFKTKLHPVVYGENLVDTALPTILFYGHYDVQPAAPLNEWKTDPFKPQISENYLYGRGASDDKGQMFLHLKAIELYLKQLGAPPVNIKCIFEGEEEIGSPNLEGFIQANQGLLACDVAVVSDTSMVSPRQPAITYSLRGSLNVEITVIAQRKELHSGTFGGMVSNPAFGLAEIIGKLHFKNNRVAIPGFYDDVKDVAPAERAYLKRTGPSSHNIRIQSGGAVSWGEIGFSNYERITIRPSLTVTSIQSGYRGNGAKNSIPTTATARLNIRLVSNQHPGQIEYLLREYIKSITPLGLNAIVKVSSKAKPVVLSIENKFMRAASTSLEYAFGKKPVFLRNGGTIPVVNLFNELLNVPTVLMGFGLPDDNIHGPNEKFYLPNFFRGINASMNFMKQVSTMEQMPKSARKLALLNTIPQL